MTKSNIGILLCNIGTPAHPTPHAVKHYLSEFLSDRRVVEIPRVLWWPILHGYILRTRPKHSAKLYQKIWTTEGSPLLCYSRKLAQALEDKIQIPVALGMHYGQPSLQHALDELRKKNINKILIFPLYPQYSATTTASAFDKIARTLKHWRVIPEIRMIQDYADNEFYIQALCQSIRASCDRDHLLFSFHGIPERNVKHGDPYQTRCHTTVQRIAHELNLTSEQYSIAFQSRLGRAKWLSPYTDHVLKALPQKNIKKLHVICPGFAVDCLETLEEIAIRGKAQFEQQGGEIFQYIPALNNSPDHIEALAKIIQNHLSHW